MRDVSIIGIGQTPVGEHWETSLRHLAFNAIDAVLNDAGVPQTIDAVYVGNMQRLLKKFEGAKAMMPAPVHRDAKRKTSDGVIYFGSTTPAMHEALDALEAQGRHLDGMRVRGFPFAKEVDAFIAAHERVFVVEQNRDGQLRTLLVNEGEIDPAKLVPVLHYDGTPITARFIAGKIAQLMAVGQIEAAE